jgi:hypothetical protein
MGGKDGMRYGLECEAIKEYSKLSRLSLNSAWMKIRAWRSIILRRPREDEGSGVLDVLGDEIEPGFCFHSSPNTVSQHYRTG